MAPRSYLSIRESRIRISRNINTECQRVNTKRSYQRDCHAIQIWIGLQLQAEVGRGKWERGEVFIFYALTVASTHTHTHRVWPFRIRSRNVGNERLSWRAAAAGATGNWQAAKATWPGLHPIGQKVNFLCSSCVVLLLISYVCYCCFCSSRVASWANGLLLAKLTHTHTSTGGPLGQHVLGAVCAPKCKSPCRALMLTRPLAV